MALRVTRVAPTFGSAPMASCTTCAGASGPMGCVVKEPTEMDQRPCKSASPQGPASTSSVHVSEDLVNESAVVHSTR